MERLDVTSLPVPAPAGTLPHGAMEALAQGLAGLVGELPDELPMLVALDWMVDPDPAQLASLDQLVAGSPLPTRSGACTALECTWLPMPAGHLPDCLHGHLLPRPAAGAALVLQGGTVVVAMRSGQHLVHPAGAGVDPLVLDVVLRCLGAPTPPCAFDATEVVVRTWLLTVLDQCLQGGVTPEVLDVSFPLTLDSLAGPALDSWEHWRTLVAPTSPLARWFDTPSFARRTLDGLPLPSELLADVAAAAGPDVAARARQLLDGAGLLRPPRPFEPAPPPGDHDRCPCGAPRTWSACHGAPAPVAMVVHGTHPDTPDPDGTRPTDPRPGGATDR